MCAGTFLSGAALQVHLSAVLAAGAGPPLLLQQLVDALDDALQRLVHVEPDLLLSRQEQKKKLLKASDRVRARSGHSRADAPAPGPRP